MSAPQDAERRIAAAGITMAAAEVRGAMERNDREPWWWVTLVIVGLGILGTLAWRYVA